MSRFFQYVLSASLLATLPGVAQAQLLDQLEGLLNRQAEDAGAENPAVDPPALPRIETPGEAAQPPEIDPPASLDPAQPTPLLPPPVSPKPAGRGYLGLVADHSDEDPPRVVVLRVNVGGPAEAAGIRVGDVLTSVNGEAINSLEALGAALAERRAGQEVRLEYQRGGVVQTAAVTLGTVPGEPAAPSGEQSPSAGGGWLGVHVTPVTDANYRQNGLAVRRGALINSIRGGSPAERASLPVGGVIVAIDDLRIDSPDELVAEISRHTPGETVELQIYRGTELERRSVMLAQSPARVGGSTLGEATSAENRARPLLDQLPVEGPLFDRLGDALDRFAEPRAGGEPGQVESLKEQVELLTRQVELMRSQINQLERELSEARTPPIDPLHP